jgi:tetratricopeptide (TPR) repeat protein
MERMRAMLAMFGEAFDEIDTYTARQPNDAYLENLLANDNFISLAAVRDNVVVGGLAAYELPKFEQERSEIYNDGQISTAIEQFEEVLKTIPDLVGAHNNLGTLYARQGNLENSLIHFQRAARLRPDSPDAQRNVGRILLQIGRTSDAIDFLQAAVRLQPNFAPAYAELSQVLADANRSADAIAMAKRGIDVVRGTGQEAAVVELEEWLHQYQMKLNRDDKADGKP